MHLGSIEWDCEIIPYPARNLPYGIKSSSIHLTPGNASTLISNYTVKLAENQGLTVNPIPVFSPLGDVDNVITQSHDYDGYIKCGVVGGAEETDDYYFTETPYATDAGTYTVIVHLKEGRAWKDSAGNLLDPAKRYEPQTGEWTIRKVKLTLPTITNYTGEYDGKPHSITMSGAVGVAQYYWAEDTSNYYCYISPDNITSPWNGPYTYASGDSLNEWETTIKKYTNVENKNIYIYCLPDNNHLLAQEPTYAGGNVRVEEHGTVNITKAKITLTLSESSYGDLYAGDERTVGYTLKTSTDFDCPGKIYLSSNYIGPNPSSVANSSACYTIKEPTISDISATFDGTDGSFTYQGKSFTNGTTYLYIRFVPNDRNNYVCEGNSSDYGYPTSPQYKRYEINTVKRSPISLTLSNGSLNSDISLVAGSTYKYQTNEDVNYLGVKKSVRYNLKSDRGYDCPGKLSISVQGVKIAEPNPSTNISVTVTGEGTSGEIYYYPTGNGYTDLYLTVSFTPEETGKFSVPSSNRLDIKNSTKIPIIVKQDETWEKAYKDLPYQWTYTLDDTAVPGAPDCKINLSYSRSTSIIRIDSAYNSVVTLKPDAVLRKAISFTPIRTHDTDTAISSSISLDSGTIPELGVGYSTIFYLTDATLTLTINKILDTISDEKEPWGKVEFNMNAERLTNTRIINVDVTAIDDVDVHQIALINEKDFGSGINSSGDLNEYWQAWTGSSTNPTVPYQVELSSGDGPKVVYLFIKDIVGKVSGPFSTGN